MKYTLYMVCFLSSILLRISDNLTYLQAQTTPSPTSADNSKKTDPISQEVLKSLGLESYKYEHNPRNRDPFISLRQELGDSKQIVNQTVLGPYLPLERFDIDQFQLMGIIWNTDEPRALLMDPNKQSHIVKKNDRIGLYKGYLAEIREGEIIIAEPKQQGLKIQYNIKTLSITKEQAKKQNVENIPIN